ncbi:eukaryotic translation initiation factor 5 [Cantharellus anzutake]|uniref:eukaryotic translation initiation factor 5 n=1 Tax=Cantharellus anzutake TaxID=1750568 RepID=UPI001902DAED|nr:eukaryotic translation initiation factor 5 [Cantharellus anzutake]KAF8338179.1 eukaryotic translation initiation factor 5 [Cantharellus anzutake]
MAKIVNIRRDVDDKFYRYKMPSLLTKIEGKGNGIKTVIPNMSDVSRALSRPPTYTTKFFGSELGAQTSCDEKNDRYIVNGAHQADRLRELLDVFIDKFVLCASCKNPETDLVLTKNEDIIRDCKACGQHTGIDMRHKLASYILRNPPKKAKKTKGTHATASNGGATGGNGSPDEEGGSDDEFTKKLRAEAAVLPTADQVKVDENDWSLDTSAGAVRARQKTLEASVAGLTLGEEESEGEDPDSPYSILGKWVEENRDGSAVGFYKKAEELGVERKSKAVQIIAQKLFTDDVVKELEKFAPLFKKMVTSEKHQKALMGGIERFVGADQPELIPLIPKILMVLYQADILEEDFIKQWGTHVSKKYVDRDTSKKVRKASDPFLKWLEEAESDDE